MIDINRLLTIGFILITTLITNSYAKEEIPINNNGNVSFLAIGDTPYTQDEEFELNNKVIPAIQKRNYPFVVVHGDILSGAESCTNKLLTKRLNRFYNIKKDYVFYTPGDNDWTDCDRSSKSEQFSELERLSYVRNYISTNQPNPPKHWNYKRQKELIENASWTYKEIQFATIHMVSTSNGRKEILKDDKNKALDKVDYRDQANLQWLDFTFEEAKKSNAKAIIIVSQADVTKSKYKSICTKTNRVKCNPFESFTNHLRQKAKEFKNSKGENKPVLFLHGDSNPYCFDKKFGKDITPNLWRLNAWGDYKPYADATVVTFNPDNKNKPFEAHTLTSNELPKVSCSKQ